MTVDPEKIRIFETDPCGMKGFYRAETVDGVVYHRGNCTLPNQVRCRAITRFVFLPLSNIT